MPAMEDIRTQTLADLVTRETGVASVFERYHLDYCCKGKRTLADAATSAGLDLDELARQVESRLSHPVDEVADRFSAMPLDHLADLIEQRHHRYVRDMIPTITTHLAKVSAKHGKRHPELNEMAAIWQRLAGELTAHLEKEEVVLFPYIRRMVEVRRNGRYHLLPVVPVLNKPVRTLERDHERTGLLLDELRDHSLDFAPPEDACMTYQLTFKELEAFETDLHRHLHLENNILFPRARTLEQSLFAMS
jgi:regulator of cell morphogenesis and NO signaling